MKKLIFAFVVFTSMCVASCHTTKVVDEQDGATYGVSAQAAQTFRPETLSVAGIDSLLKADRLPAVKKWSAAYYKDDETNERNEYRTLYDRTSWTVYTLKKIGSEQWVLVKRMLKVAQ